MKSKHFSLSAKIVSVFYIVLITLFAFDTKVLSLGFLIHLLPTAIFVFCLAVSWFKPKIGGILFIIMGAGTIIAFNTYRDLLVLLAISAVPIIIGILFFISKKK